MQILSMHYPQFSQNNYNFGGRKPLPKIIKTPETSLRVKPSKEFLASLIEQGLSNEQIAKKLNRALQTIVGLRCQYGLPSEYQQSLIERTKKIIESIKSGVSREELAKELGVSKGTINRIAEEYNLFNQRIAIREEKILEMIKDGASRTEIAKALNVSIDTITRTAKKYNLTLKNKTSSIDIAILAKLQNNESTKKIMEDLNISYTPINRIKKELGLQRVYNRNPKPQEILWTEIMQESKKVTKIRQAFKRLKEGERTPEILEQISTTIDELKSAIDEFKARVQK